VSEANDASPAEPKIVAIGDATEESKGEDWGEDEEEETPESQITRALMKELVRLRKRKKIAQEPLAKSMGLTQGRLSQIEHLKGGSMSLEAFIRYAHTIGAEVILQPSDEEE